MLGPATPVFRPQVPPLLQHPVGVIQFLWIMWRDPLLAFRETQLDLPYIHVRKSLLFSEIINVTDPAGVRRVLLDNAKNYEKGEFQRRVFGPLITKGVFMNEGEDWRRTRRIVAPLFTPARVAHLAARMEAVCKRRVESWLGGADEAVLDIDSEMMRITFEVISETMFSNEIGGEAKAFEEAFNSFVDTIGRISPMDLFGAPAWVPRLGKLAGAKANAFFERRVYELAAERRALMARGQIPPDDLLTALLSARDEDGGPGLSEDEVAANILTFIIAGHETTARALGWALHLLSRTPEYLAKLHTEADAFDLARPDWQAALPWSRAVFDETLRLFPPAPTTLRVALGPDVICGQPVQKGAMVVIAPYLIQRHRARWKDPHAFLPERFLPGEREKIDRFAYIPFSGGPRICIGATFAIQEALIALAVILRSVTLEPVDPEEPMPSHRVTLRAKDGIRLRIRSRTS